MTTPYEDTYFVDDLNLASYATRIESSETLQDAPEPVGDDVPLPGLDGALEVYGLPGQQRRPDGPAEITFNLALQGVDPDTGQWLDDGDSAEWYFAQWDELVRRLSRRRVLLRHPRPDGDRLAYAHRVGGMAPVRSPASPWFGRFKATFAIPAGHWEDADTVTTGLVSLASGGVLSLAAFGGATAPCTDLAVRFAAGSNPRLTSSTGRVGWNGVIAPGRQVLIDTATGLTSSGSGSAWTPGYANPDGSPLLDYSPGPRYFEVDPSEPLSAVLTHTGGGSMSVEVSGKRRYRTS